MTIKDKKPINQDDIKMGEEMSYISFGDLIKELTGSSFDEYYQKYPFHMETKDEKNNME